MYRFFVPPETLASQPVVLGPDLAHRLGRVLRLRPGDRVVLLDNTGWEYGGEIVRLMPDRVELRLVSQARAQGEPATRIHLYQGLLKGAKFEWVLQKGTELGLASFTPLLCRRATVGPPSPVAQARWRTIVQQAAEQARRGRLPAVNPPLPLADALASAPSLRLFPWEGEGVRGLRSALQGAVEGASRDNPEARSLLPEVSLFIGPEGGWEEDEVALALAQGAVPVGLGPRILRAETAGLVAAAAIFYHTGELGG